MLMTRDAGDIVRDFYSSILTAGSRNPEKPPPDNEFTQYPVSARPSGLKKFRQFFASINRAFPEYELKIESLVVNGDRVMVRYSIRGIQEGDFMGIAPSRQPMIISGIDIFRVDDGQVVEHWDAVHQINAYR